MNRRRLANAHHFTHTYTRRAKKDYFKAINGVYSTPEVYFVSEADAESFDKTFPFKVKEKLPSQIF